ncbi:MAG: hypothetical protein Q7T12_00510 [Flavobacterium sp.]|nr:hypothetical protein [Flavobacterium sp.]
MENNETIEYTSLFKHQKVFSKFLAFASGGIILMTLILAGAITDIEFFHDIIIVFNLLYLFFFIVGYSIFFALNIKKYKKYKLEQSKIFLKYFVIIFLLPISYIFCVKYYMGDGKYNLIMTPRDTGAFLFNSIFIWINMRVYRNSGEI